MSSESVRALEATDVIALREEAALRVETGVVLVFVVPRSPGGPGRRIPLHQALPGEIVTGAALTEADLMAAGLPGTQIALLPEADPEAVRRMAQLATEALGRAQQADADTAALQWVQLHHDERVVDDALLELAATVPGEQRARFGEEAVPRDEAVIDFLARQVGLHPDPLRLRRAVTDAEVTGRDRVIALAAAAGAAVRPVELPPNWWRREGPPLMLEVDGRLTAAVWRRRAYHLWDPDQGLGQPVKAGTQGQVRRGTLLEPLLDPGRPSGTRDLLRLGARGSRMTLLLVATLTVVVGLLAAVIPLVAGALTQTVASQTTSTLLVVGCALVALAAGDAMVRGVRMFALLRVRGRGVAVTATAVWDRLLRLPMSWHARRSVASRMTDANAVDTASMIMPDSTVTALLDVAAVGGAVIGVLFTNSALALALIAFLIVRVAVDVALVATAARLTRQALEARTHSQSAALEITRGVDRLRASGASRRAFARWARTEAVTTGMEVRQRRLTVFQQVFGAIWPTLGLAALFVVTAWSGADVGQFVTAQTALTAATSAMGAAIAAVGAFLATRAVLARADEALRAEPESGTGQEVAALGGAIDLRDVTFRYRADLPTVLDGVSLSIPAGAHVAVVGPSGCGKSTLLRLLLGLEEPDAGVVSYDGRDLSGLDRSSIRRQIGTVMQSSQLLPGSIRDNVDLGRGLTVSQIWEVLEMAAVADDVRAMPMGLSTVVVEGAATISGGQRQRILLARALAGRPRILLLDEATSALDNVSQAAVIQTLDRLDCTRVVVAHRLSTIERADLVLMFTDGRVVEQGLFQELMDRPGPFHDLVARQRL